MALIEAWQRDNGDVPYEIVSTSGFNAFEGIPVAHVVCRAAFPHNMRWPNGQ